MQRVFAVILFCLGAFCVAHAQTGNLDLGISKSVPSSGGCSQATTLNAALSGQNTSAVTTLICGMVTDGTYAKLLGLYVAATNSLANFEVNWANPGTFNLTAHSAANCTFTANTNIKGDGSTCYFDTSFVPSVSGGTLWTTSAASVSACISVAPGANSGVEIGVTDASNNAFLQPNSGTNFTYEIQGGLFPSVSTTVTGNFVAVRTGSNSVALYKNATSIGTATETDGAVITKSIYVLAFNNNGTPVDFSQDTNVYFFMGGTLSSTDITNIRSRMNTYITTVAGSSPC